MAQDTTKQQQPAQGATPEGGAASSERYGPSEHYETGSTQGSRSSQGYGTGSGSAQGQGNLSQRNAMRGEGRGMTTSRGGATSPYGGYTNPFELMQRMGEEMDRLFESFGFGPSLFGRGQGGRSMMPFGNVGSWGGTGSLAQLWSPRIEVFEREGRLVVEADLPGVRKEDLSVQIEQEAIVIQGQRRQEQTSNERGYYHSERSYGSFHRIIPLPEGADADNARARFRDGVLEVEVPIQQRSRGRTLEIQDAQEAGRTYEGATGQTGQRGTSTATSGAAAGHPGTAPTGGGTSPATGVSGAGSTGGRAGSV